MTTSGSDTPDKAHGDESAATAGPARKRHRAVLVLVSVVAVAIVLSLVAVLIGRGQDETNPLDDDAPHLADFTVQPVGGCPYDPDRGGLVAHFEVSARTAGRFTVDLEAVTQDGLDNLDISTTHVVRFTVPFYGDQTRREFDVVVPLTKTDYEDGYRECRYTVNPTGG